MSDAATKMTLKWESPEVAKGLRAYRASAGDGSEYLISGTHLRVVPGTRTVDEYFIVSRCRTGGGDSRPVLVREHIGTAPTLKDAKVLALQSRTKRI